MVTRVGFFENSGLSFSNTMMSYIIQRMPCEGCYRIQRFGVDGRKLFRSNQEPFGQTSYLWTRIFLKTRGKILRVEKYGDTCARIASHAEFVTRSCPTRDEPLRTSAWEASAREA